MKILYISHDGMTDPLGQSQVIPYLVRLSEKDFEITILSSEKKENYEKNYSIVRSLLSEKKIQWLSIKYSSTFPIFSRWFNYKKLQKAAFSIYLKENFSIVHCRSYIASLIGLEFKRKYNAKFIFDMRGFWADERIDGGIWNLKNLIQRKLYYYFKKKELEFLNEADCVISLTESAKAEIYRWNGIKKNNLIIEVIPCCADLNHFSQQNFSETEKTRVRAELGISKTDFVLSYLGSLGTWYLLDEMMRFFIRIIYEHTDARFLFITTENPETIYCAAKKLGLKKNRIVVKSTAREHVPLYASLSNLSIFFIKRTFSKIASSPTKMGELLALGIPIITNSGIGDCDKILLETGSGVVVDEINEDGIESAINQLDKLLSTDRNVMRTTAEEYFSLEKGIDTYDRIYRELISK